MAENDTPWFEALEPELKAHAAAKGWDKVEAAVLPAELVKAHYAAQKLIGTPAEQLLKLPKDATDPTYQSAYDKIVGMSIPKDPAEYKFDGLKFKDGTPLGAEDQEFVRGLAVKHKLSPAAAQGVAAELVARADSSDAGDTKASDERKAANGAYLLTQWGAQHDAKAFAATRAANAAGLSPEVFQHIATLEPTVYKQNMDALVALGEKMGEAAMLRGNVAMERDPTVGVTPEEAQKQLTAFNSDRAWQQKFFANDTETVSQWKKLTTIVAAARVPQR